MAERAEGRVVPGGYIHPKRGSHMRGPGGERRGLVDGNNEDDDNDYEGGGGFGMDRDDGPGGGMVRSSSPGVDVDEREWSEWDRTVRAGPGEGRRGRQRLSNEVGMDDGEGPFARSSTQGDGWQRL